MSCIIPKIRPEVLKGSTTKVHTGCGTLYITITVTEEEHPLKYL